MDSGRNNVFHGNAIIAQKGIYVGKGGDLMKLFINWADLTPTIDSGIATITETRNLSYQQAGDQVKILIDMTLLVVSAGDSRLPLVITGAPVPVGTDPYFNSALVDINANPQHGMLEVSQSGAITYLVVDGLGNPMVLNDPIVITGEISYTTSN
jgi:hypothetical protein